MSPFFVQLRIKTIDFFSSVKRSKNRYKSQGKKIEKQYPIRGIKKLKTLVFSSSVKEYSLV